MFFVCPPTRDLLAGGPRGGGAGDFCKGKNDKKNEKNRGRTRSKNSCSSSLTFSLLSLWLASTLSPFFLVSFCLSLSVREMGAYVSAPIAHCAAAAPPALAGDKTATASSSPLPPPSSTSGSGSLLPAAAQAAIYGEKVSIREKSLFSESSSSSLQP